MWSYFICCMGGVEAQIKLSLSSNFFDHLEVNLADCGFDIKDDAGFYGYEVEIPAFTTICAGCGKTRAFAYLRIHVECVIGAVRQKYLIRSHTVPLEYMMTFSEIHVPKIEKNCKVLLCTFQLK